MNLDHIKSESLRQLQLGHGPLTNLEDFNEYGLSSHSDSAEAAVPYSASPLRKKSKSPRRNTLSKSAAAAAVIPTMEVLHSMDEDLDVDSNSNFQSSSSSDDADSYSDADPLTLSMSAIPKPHEAEGSGGDDGLTLFRQYSARQRMKRRRSRKKQSGSAGTLGLGSGHRSEFDDSSSSDADHAPPALMRSATVKMGKSRRAKKSKKIKTPKSSRAVPKEEDLEAKEGGLALPGSTHLHHRSFSESALRRIRSNGHTQWPSTGSEDESEDIENRLLSMKRKLLIH